MTSSQSCLQNRQRGRCKNYSPVSLMQSFRRWWRKIPLEIISKGMKNQKVLRSGQPEFLKGKSKTVYKTNPKLLNLCLSDLQDGTECTIKQVCRAHKSGRNGGCSRWLCCPSGDLDRRNAEQGKEECDEAQQGQLQSPASGEKQPYAPVCTGDCTPGRELC